MRSIRLDQRHRSKRSFDIEELRVRDVDYGADGSATLKAYQLWAPIYDLIWGAMLAQGRREASRAACRVGGRILEVGIGTGLSLEHYRGDVELFGIDLCHDMLSKAMAKVRRGDFPNVKSLDIMNAQHLGFADSFFDCVVAQFVITVVDRPEQVLSECVRVVRPGGEIILVNHFSPARGIARRLERWMARPLRSLGIPREVSIAALLDWIDPDPRVELIECRTVGLFGSNTLVRCRRV